MALWFGFDECHGSFGRLSVVTGIASFRCTDQVLPRPLVAIQTLARAKVTFRYIRRQQASVRHTSWYMILSKEVIGRPRDLLQDVYVESHDYTRSIESLIMKNSKGVK
jgi:hypothetical protein